MTFLHGQHVPAWTQAWFGLGAPAHMGTTDITAHSVYARGCTFI